MVKDIDSGYQGTPGFLFKKRTNEHTKDTVPARLSAPPIGRTRGSLLPLLLPEQCDDILQILSATIETAEPAAGGVRHGHQAAAVRGAFPRRRPGAAHRGRVGATVAVAVAVVAPQKAALVAGLREVEGRLGLQRGGDGVVVDGETRCARPGPGPGFFLFFLPFLTRSVSTGA